MNIELEIERDKEYKFLVNPLFDLPNRKYYQMDSYNKSWYKYVDRECHRFRIFSRVMNPWDEEKLILVTNVSKNKSDSSVYPSYQNFKLYPFKEHDLNFYKHRSLLRDYRKGHFIHTTEPSYLFSAFPIEDEGLKPLIWLTYTILV